MIKNPLTIMCVAFAVLASYFAFGLLSFGWQFRSAYRQIIDRHDEPTEFIRCVYGYYAQNNKWPGKEDLAQLPVPLPKEWEYDGVEYDDPHVRLHGPFHMILSYHFDGPSGYNVTRKTWRLNIEGSEETFETNHLYD